MGNDRRYILNSIIVSTPGSRESILTAQAATPLNNDRNVGLGIIGSLESSTSAYQYSCWASGPALFMTAGDREAEVGEFSRVLLSDRSF